MQQLRRLARPKLKWGLVALMLAGLIAPLCLTGATLAVSRVGTPTSWQKGVSLWPFSGAGDWSSSRSDQAIAYAKQNNVNYLTLIIPWQQDSINSTNIYSAPYAPTDSDIVHAISTAHSQGLKVALKPQIDPSDGSWRAYINPTDRDTWYANYTNRLGHLADIGVANGVEEMIIGAELIKMSTFTENSYNTQRWGQIIDNLRNVHHFQGLLTYSANWGGSDFTQEFTHIGFWNKLDFIGISAYFEVGTYADPTISDLEAKWDQYRTSMVQPFQQQIGKPVLFTEVGYRSYSGAAMHPWDSNSNISAPYDGPEQANALQALLDYWSRYSWFAGVQYWWWHTDINCCGVGNKDYQPLGKPALTVMHDWFGNTNTVTPPVFSLVSTGVTPGQGYQGGNFSLAASVKSDSVASATVLMQVYDPSNNKVFEKYFNPYSFQANTPQSFSASWSAPANAPTGTYVLSVGVVNPNDHSNFYLWQSVASTFMVSAAPSCLVVTSNTDNGGCGSLSQAILTANNGAAKTITFNPANPGQPVQLGGGTSLTVGPGVTLQGTCNNGQPGITISPASGGPVSLVVNGGSLNGLKITGFSQPQLKLSGGAKLMCVKVVG